MPSVTKRDAASRQGASDDRRLARVLESSALARIVPLLPPEGLHRLVQRCGIGACGELLVSASTAQLNALADLDLWRADAGGDHQLDVQRFGEWLEVLVDVGQHEAASAVAALDGAIVVAGLSRYVRVFDPGIFEPTAQSDDETPDWREAMRDGDTRGASRSSVSLAGDCEIGGYIVRARRPQAWDAVVAVLTTLDDEHPATFDAVIRGCRALSNSDPEVDGLDDLLSLPDQHLHDVGDARAQRRATYGYAEAAEARAFLAMARGPSSPNAARNPIVAAYFRALDDAPAATSDRADTAALVSSPEPTASGRTGEHARTDDASIADVMTLLWEAGVLPQPPRGRLTGGAAEMDSDGTTTLRRLMGHAQDVDMTAWLARTREIAFLANVLMAGCSVQSRAFTSDEAAAAAAAVCNLGLELAGSVPDGFLVRQDLMGVFETGWRGLHEQVRAPVVDALIAGLGNRRTVDHVLSADLFLFRRALIRHRDAGT
ncbi:MAG TPA: DUF6178 family protein, partial [Luteitalea sp.]|nr:DUF6178 family protein [Luteitalea sp.]